jgi:predicted permease
VLQTILESLLPVVFVIALGWLAGRLKLLLHDDAQVLATFIIRFALPFALFEGAIKTPSEKLHDVPFALCLFIGLMGTFFIALAVGRWYFKHDLRTSTMQALVCAFPDMAYFGAPILAVVFGPEGFLPVLVGNLITSMFMLPLTIILTNTDGKKRAGHNSAVKLIAKNIAGAVINPIVWLPLLGCAFSFMHVKLPAPLMDSAGLVAKSAGGTSLFALGLMLYGERFRINADVVANTVMKNFMQPALIVGAVLLLGVSGAPAHELIITGAVPTATAASMFALKNKTYTGNATATILLSTLLGILTEAALIGLFAR